jgi:hypothetical protein
LAAITGNRLDSLDTERFETMIGSPAFALLRARMVAELERARNDCETQCELVQTRAQGQAKAFRTALDLPAIMLREMKERKK